MFVDRKFIYYRHKLSDIEELESAAASCSYMLRAIDQAENKSQSSSKGDSFIAGCRAGYVCERRFAPVPLLAQKVVPADSRDVLTGIANLVFQFRRGWKTAVTGVRRSFEEVCDVESDDPLVRLLLDEVTSEEVLSNKIQEILDEVDFGEMEEHKKDRESQKLARAIRLLCTETRRDIRQAVLISRAAKQKDELDQCSLEDADSSQPQIWHGKSRESRTALNANDAKLFTAWIFYLKMLIGDVLGPGFQFAEGETSEISRADVILEYLKSILSHCLSQSIVVANSCHARQDASRLRHTGHAYMNHCREVAEEAAFAILPFYFEKAMHGNAEDLKRAVVMTICIGIIGPIHDVIEDVKRGGVSTWNIDAIISDIVSRVNVWDTLFDGPLRDIEAYRKTHLDGSVGEASQSKGLDELKQELALITEKSLIEALKLIEKILSKDSEKTLTDQERAIILQQNIAGKPATLDLIGGDCEGLQEQPASAFFQKYVRYDRKMTAFVVREHALPEVLRDVDPFMADVVRYISLCYKLIDRKNNLGTVLQVNIDRPADAFRILRTSYADIVKYAVELYPAIGQPMDLFNALPMLLQELLKVYKQARDGVEFEGYGRFESQGQYDAEVDDKFIEEIEVLVAKYSMREIPF